VRAAVLGGAMCLIASRRHALVEFLLMIM
jgi:hypothetical protein